MSGRGVLVGSGWSVAVGVAVRTGVGVGPQLKRTIDKISKIKEIDCALTLNGTSSHNAHTRFLINYAKLMVQFEHKYFLD